MKARIVCRIKNRVISDGRKCWEYVRLLTLLPIAKAVYGKRDVYLFAERGSDARDNAYHLFKYFREHYPDREAYYVINKNSADFGKVAAIGEVVQYKSMKHYLLFIGAKYKISTHIMGFSPDMNTYMSVNKRFRIPGFQIFLQHGVIKDNLVGLYQKNTKLDLFICGAKPEYDYVSENFQYSNGEVQYTGLARFDALHLRESKNYILCMPTWRSYYRNLSEEEFRSCAYYKNWTALIQDPKIISALRERQMKLIFYPHYEMQRFVHLFHSQCDEIVIADFDHYDVQQLLKEAKLLITDYSSVFFDFAYMKKPCLYFQFDQQEFISKHYQRGYFDYSKHGFGPVVEALPEAVDAICEGIRNGCKMEEAYAKRIEGFFLLSDEKNCERIMQAIEKLK